MLNLMNFDLMIVRHPRHGQHRYRPTELVAICIKHDEYCFQNDEICMQNDEYCVQNDEICIQNDDLNINVQAARDWQRQRRRGRIQRE